MTETGLPASLAAAADRRAANTAFDRRRGLTIAAACAAFALGMVGAAYASVPLYRMFCAATGYGGTTQRAAAAAGPVSDESVTVRFDANASPSVPWSFQPLEREVRVRLGETRQIAYRVKNRSDHTVTASATFNVTPDAAGAYFNKIQCFCFSEQTLKAGEERDMPVIFFVDPALLQSEDIGDRPAITLSYTFFPADEPASSADAAPPAGAAPARRL